MQKKDSSGKRVVAIVFGSYQLLQVLWYYSMFPEDEYTVIIKKYGQNPEAQDDLQKKMLVLCRKSGIFARVIQSDMVTPITNIFSKVKLMLKMMLYFITGSRSKLTRKIITENLGHFDFDKALVDSEASILGGAFIDWAKEKEIIILEEGLSDIIDRRTLPKFKFYEICGFVLAKMGYFDFTFGFGLKNTLFCEKYVSSLGLITDKRFKCLSKLFETTKGDSLLYKRLIKGIFNNINWWLIKNSQIIIFTSIFQCFSKSNDYYEEMHQWLLLNQKSKKILIKKHPQDLLKYDWEDLDIEILDGYIPAEILISQIGEQEVVLMIMSTTILTLIANNKKFKVLKFESITNNSYNVEHEELKKKLRIEDKQIEII